MTRLLLIRHAHTLSNVGSGTALSGRTDTPLSSRGRYEVETLRSCARNAGPVAAIYTSPLRRALETASGLEMVGPGPYRVLPALQEIDCGFVDGLPIHDVRCRHPDLWAANLRQDDERFRWPGGESYREFRCRCLRAIRAIAEAHPGECVAVVTHAGVISQILGALQGINPARWETNRPGNASVTEILWGRGTGELLGFDDRSHLGPLTSIRCSA